MKSIHKFRTSFLLFFVMALLSSCLTNVDEVEEIDLGNLNPCADITFTTHIKPIIDSNCVSCHNGGQFPNLSTYNGISANAAIVKEEVVTKRMPQGSPLSDADILAISCWVDAGAQNN
ncbi:c-type cytochrome [Polaribacter sp. R77954]|uniref:c-type cytochrome n=1 Tax=Polaribacter sp. R77954 TaxID=3093870 RepID=UPI0037C83206